MTERKAAKKDDGQAAALAKIAAMPEPFRAIGERIHTVVLHSAPLLEATTWYGMPAYAKNGKTLCFFRADKKYMTFGLTQDVDLAPEPGAQDKLMECAWYLTDLNEATEEKVARIVRKIAK